MNFTSEAERSGYRSRSSTVEGNVQAVGGETPMAMELSSSVIDANAAEYPAVQPLSTVEEEHIEMLPTTLERGEYGWRDIEWIVQWYFRRFLGGYPDAERRAIEDAFGENSYEAVHDAIDAAVDGTGAAEKLRPLLGLSGVDVAVGSAFLHFLDPDSYLVVGEDEWETLARAGEFTETYPESLTVDDYERYLTTCRAISDRCDCDLQTLYRALWVLGREHEP